MTCSYYRIGDKWGGIPGGVFWGYNNKGEVMRFPFQTHYEKLLDVTLLCKLGVGDDSNDLIIDYDQEYCFGQVTLWE